MRLPSPILALVTGGLIAAGAATYQPGIRAIDGDTVAAGWWRYRLMGFDAPELRRARCPEERVLAGRARDRLQALANRPGAALEPRGRRDPYGRRLAVLRLPDGRDVAAVAVAEGWGHVYGGHGSRGGWCR